MEGSLTRKRARTPSDAPLTQPEASFRSQDVGYARLPSPPRRDDDADGHYVFELGESLDRRYQILSKLGEGTFGRVLECWDYHSNELVAIKVGRSFHRYRNAAKKEISILLDLARNDKTGLRFVKMHDWFKYRNHICIVFEKLGPSLFDCMQRYNYTQFPIDLVRRFGRQLLDSVAYMHELHLIHTDLKPGNILLVPSEKIKLPEMRNSRDETKPMYLPRSSCIKMIDFGSSVHADQGNRYVVSTRHYRAPEVILGFGWSYPCDMWSVGCILVELCTGELLFPALENLEHLAMMERILGPLPEHIIRKADRGAEKYFSNGARLNWPDGAAPGNSLEVVREFARLKDVVAGHVDSSKATFTDLLFSLLEYDPAKRITAHRALSHPFFSNRKEKNMA